MLLRGPSRRSHRAALLPPRWTRALAIVSGPPHDRVATQRCMLCAACCRIVRRVGGFGPRAERWPPGSRTCRDRDLAAEEQPDYFGSADSDVRCGIWPFQLRTTAGCFLRRRRHAAPLQAGCRVTARPLGQTLLWWLNCVFTPRTARRRGSPWASARHSSYGRTDQLVSDQLAMRTAGGGSPPQSNTSRSFCANWSKVYGLDRNCTSGSSTPLCTTALRVNPVV